jgi:hypothetical protein
MTDSQEDMAMARGNTDGRPIYLASLEEAAKQVSMAARPQSWCRRRLRAEYARMGQGNTMSGGESTDCGEFPNIE